MSESAAVVFSPLPATIPELVEAAARDHGGCDALVEIGGDRISFTDVETRVRRVSRALIARGFEAGDRAALWAPNSSAWAEAALGVLSAGGVVVPVNTRFKGAEARYVLEKSRARVIFTVRDFLGVDYPALLAAACADTPLVDLEHSVVLDDPEWEGFLDSGSAITDATLRQRRAELGSDSVSDIVFTSGTTGHPKGVMTTHGQTLRVFATWAETVGLEAGDRYLVVNPFFHTFGYKAGLIASLLAGATVIPMATLDPLALMATVQEERVTVLPGPPTLYATLLDHPERRSFDLSSLRLAVTGASVVPVELVRRIREDLGIETVLTAYGLTEATGTVSMCRRGDDVETIAKTSGRAIPGTEVAIVDDEGRPLPSGRPGEVTVRGYNVMLGYLDDPEQTAEAIDDRGWLHTGDIGVLDAEGNLTITDRKKDMFIVGGFNAYPAEIENLLCGHPSVSQAAVIGVPDDRLGEVGMAFVVLRPGARIEEAGLIEWARSSMANYKVPRQVRFVEALPLNASGKVLKGELRATSRS